MENLNDQHLFEQLPEEEKSFLLHWIAENLRPVQRFNTRHHSYEMKHWVMDEYPERYYSNGEFKGAMLASGYRVQNTGADNWVFNISEQSPYLAKKKAQNQFL